MAWVDERQCKPRDGVAKLVVAAKVSNQRGVGCSGGHAYSSGFDQGYDRRAGVPVRAPRSAGGQSKVEADQDQTACGRRLYRLHGVPVPSET